MHDSLSCKIDTLIQHSSEVIKYVEKQQQMPESHFTPFGIFLLAIFALLFVAATFRFGGKKTWVDKFIIPSNDVKEDELEKSEKIRNYKWVAYWLTASSILFWALLEFGYIHNDKKFTISHADMLLAVASVIAIVGAVWAVFARIDAEKAFKKSQQTLDAIGSTFGFEEILNSDKLVEVIGAIGLNDTKVHLFLGFPCIGYLYEDKSKFKNKPEILFMDFNDRLSMLLTGLEAKRIQNFEFNIAIFKHSDTKDLLTTNGVYQPIKLGERDIINEFYKSIEGLKKLNNNLIKITEIERNENLRFASVQYHDQPTHKSKAIVWVVRDLTKDVKNFDSRAFQSSDTKLISVLLSAFE